MIEKPKFASSASTNDLAAASKSSALARATSSFGEVAQSTSLADAVRAVSGASPTSLANAMRAATGAASSRSIPAPKPHKILSAVDLGPLVRAARRTMGLSQQAFADLAGVGRRFVSELESGKPTLEFDKVLKVCAAAGVDIAASMRSPS